MGMARLFDHFRLIAPAYDRVFRYDETQSPRELLRMSGDGWLLDAGGGTGRVAETLSDLTTRLVILDESGGMLRQATTKGFVAVLGTVEALPFRTHSFERILMVDAFHHLRDQARSATEIVRTLARDGRLVMQEPDIRHRGVRWIALLEKLLLMRSRFLPPASVRQLFTDAGARVEVQSMNPHFVLTAERETVS